MNIGDCPYDDCDNLLMLEAPERTPVYERLCCNGCKRELWYRLSRINPEAWTAQQFEAKHVIDPIAKTIVRRAPGV